MQRIFQSCGSIDTDSLKILFTQYETTVSGLPPSAVTVYLAQLFLSNCPLFQAPLILDKLEKLMYLF